MADSIDLLESVNRETYANEREELKAKFDSANTQAEEREFVKNKLTRIEAIDSLISH